MNNIFYKTKSSCSHYITRKAVAVFALCFCIVIFVSANSFAQTTSRSSADTSLFYDTHFHLTNYVQQGIDVHQFLKVMGTKVGRSTLFGIPLQQEWDYENSGKFAPT